MSQAHFISYGAVHKRRWQILVIFDPSPSYQPILTLEFRMTSSKKNVVNLQFLPSLSIPSKLPTSFMLGFKNSSVITKLTEILKLGFTY